MTARKAYIPLKENIHSTSDIDGVNTVFGYWGALSYPMRRRLDMAVESFRKNVGYKTILDAGYGCGIQLPDLCRRLVPAGKLYGVDIHGDHEGVYNKMAPEGITRDKVVLLEASLENLPFEDETFDLIVSVSVLEHIEPDKLRRCFSEFRRVAKNDADIVVGFPSRSFFIWALSWIQGQDLKKNHPSSHRDIFNAIEDSGFKITSMVGFPLYWGPLTMHYNLRMEKIP